MADPYTVHAQNLPTYSKAYYDAGLEDTIFYSKRGRQSIQQSSHFMNTALPLSCKKHPLSYSSPLLSFQSHQKVSPTILLFKERLASITYDLQGSFQDFKCFLQQLAFKHDAWRIWIQFVLQDAMAYVGLLLGIRGGDWDLMQSSLYEADGMFHCL